MGASVAAAPSSRVQAHYPGTRAWLLYSTWILPRSWIKLASPVLAGEFFTIFSFLFNLYDQLLFVIWGSAEKNLHKEAFPGPFIITLPFTFPVTSLFYSCQIVNTIWNDLVSLLLGTVHLSVELSCITTRT